MADLNMWVGIGRLGRDPEVRHMPNGDAAVNISIAVGKKWKDKNSGETKEQTVWVPCSFFGKTAELIGQYAKKGSQLRVNGEFHVRKYTDKDGAEKQITEIRGQDFQLLGARPDGAAAAPAPARAPAPQRQAQADAAVARQKAPIIWAEMIEAWESKLAGDTSDADARIAAAKNLAARRGYRYLDALSVARLPIAELIDRIEHVVTPSGKADVIEADALLVFNKEHGHLATDIVTRGVGHEATTTGVEIDVDLRLRVLVEARLCVGDALAGDDLALLQQHHATLTALKALGARRRREAFSGFGAGEAELQAGCTTKDTLGLGGILQTRQFDHDTAAALAQDRRCWCAGPARAGCILAHGAAERAVAHRGPRHHHCCRFGTGRLHAGLPEPLYAAGGNRHAGRAGMGLDLHDHRLPGRNPLHELQPLPALGRARPQGAGDGTDAGGQARQHPRSADRADPAAVAGAEQSQQPHRVRGADQCRLRDAESRRQCAGGAGQ